jgi:hypothetical protein
MAGFTSMTDVEPDLNAYIKEDRHGKYIMFRTG